MTTPARGRRTVGPFGGQNDGTRWCDDYHDGITKIEVSYGTLINHVRFTYVDNGKQVQGPKHGDSDGNAYVQVTLDPQNEEVIELSGYHSKHSGSEVIRSLKFKTTVTEYGPFGPEIGTPFKFPSPNSAIVGFHGYSGTYLNGIGANLPVKPPN